MTKPGPLQDLETICAEIYQRWDKDMRSGKLLGALAGIPGYRADVDRVRSALTAYPDMYAALRLVEASAISTTEPDHVAIPGSLLRMIGAAIAKAEPPTT